MSLCARVEKMWGYRGMKFKNYYIINEFMEISLWSRVLGKLTAM
jgi:hypothetical protein